MQVTKSILEYAGNTGSLSFYMIHGGSNFGFWAGANVDGQHFMPHITSYDYDAPVSEAGDYCQPGIGGPCKYDVSVGWVLPCAAGSWAGPHCYPLSRCRHLPLPCACFCCFDCTVCMGMPNVSSPVSLEQALRDLIAKHTGKALPKPPPRPEIKSYGSVSFKEAVPLFDALPELWSGEGILSELPEVGAEFGWAGRQA